MFPAVEILRFWAAAAVVWIHYPWGWMPGIRFAVPFFVVTSFFFAWKTIDGEDAGRLGRKLWRLWLPFLTWGAVSYAVAIAIGTRTGLKPLLWQMTLGHDTCKPLYYLLDAGIVMSLLFGLRRLFVRKGFWYAAVALAATCLALQYSEWNWCAFSRLPIQASYPLGRIVEFIPLAVAGCALAAIGLRGWRAVVAGAGLIVASGLITRIAAFCVEDSFGYAGLAQLAGAAGIVLAATSWKSVDSRFLAIRNVSIATAGVYFVHNIIGNALVHFGHGGYLTVLSLSFAFAFAGLHIPGLRKVLGK